MPLRCGSNKKGVGGKKKHNKSVIYYRKVKHNGGLSAAQLFSVQCINQSGSRGSFEKTFYTWNKTQLLTHLPALPRREQDPSRFMVNTIRFKVTVCKISPLEIQVLFSYTSSLQMHNPIYGGRCRTNNSGDHPSAVSVGCY